MEPRPMSQKQIVGLSGWRAQTFGVAGGSSTGGPRRKRFRESVETTELLWSA